MHGDPALVIWLYHEFSPCAIQVIRVYSRSCDLTRSSNVARQRFYIDFICCDLVGHIDVGLRVNSTLGSEFTTCGAVGAVVFLIDLEGRAVLAFWASNR